MIRSDDINPYRFNGNARWKAMREIVERSQSNNTIHYPGDRFMYPGNGKSLADFLGWTHPKRSPDYDIPVSVCRKVVLNAFPKEYVDYIWHKAAQGLDYLHEYEARRRHALKEAAAKLKITEDSWWQILKSHPEARCWIETVQQQELCLEVLYSSIYIDLRIWVSPVFCIAEEFFFIR